MCDSHHFFKVTFLDRQTTFFCLVDMKKTLQNESGKQDAGSNYSITKDVIEG
tara:strand:+ start:45 stop:200 length:156 start_codon:yes stop_codon:yes gene_type:complete